MQQAQSPERVSSGFFPHLESLRGAAAMLVVLLHMPPYLPWVNNLNIIRNGALMVPLFFVLSGFVIRHSYGARISTMSDVGKFIFLRLGRLYPVHFVFLMLFLVLELARFIVASRFNVHAPVTRPFESNSLQAFFENIFLVQALGFTGHAGTFNGPSWSISVEFYTYLLFAVATLALRTVGRANIFFVALIATSLTYELYYITIFPDLQYLASCITGFFLGCLLSSMYNSFPNTKYPVYLVYIAALFLLLFLSFRYQNPVFYLFIFPLSACLIFVLIRTRGTMVEAVLLSRPLRWLGRVSYSLYMSHWLTIWVIMQAVTVARGMSLSNDSSARYYGDIGSLQGSGLYLLTIVLAISVAAAIYKIVEEPFRRQSREFVAHLGHLPAPAGGEA